MARQVFDVTIGVRSPFLFAAVDPGAHGIDTTSLREDHGGDLPMLPGDHLRGHLRHAAAVLFEHAPAVFEQLFGRPSRDRALLESEHTDADALPPDDTADQPDPGRLIVGDFRARRFVHAGRETAIDKRRMAVFHRVAIDDDTGAAREGMLQVLDVPVPAGAVALFEGTIVLRGPVAGLPDPAGALRDLLRTVGFVGGVKSAGFGETVVDTLEIDEPAKKALRLPTVSAAKPPPTAVAAPPGLPRRLTVDIEIDQPFMVDSVRLALNVFRGAAVIPGGALKGTVAAALNDAGLLARAGGDDANAAFGRIRFGHAFPLVEADGAERLGDRVLPLAICIAGDRAGIVLDDTDLEPLIAAGTPTFPLDFKGDSVDAIRARLGRPAAMLARQARGRVAIDHNGIADEGKLFFNEPVIATGRRWRFTLSCDAGDPRLFEQVVALLRQGVHGLGRTGARVTAVVAAPEVPPPPCPAGRVRLLLETPAMLTDPASELAPGVQYRRYFEDILEAELEDFRAVAVRRTIGNYLAYRYRQRRDGPRYQPYELTEAGAVFAFTIDAAAAARLGRHLANGLPPLLDGAPARDPGTDWRRCPYVAENGFGEISLLPEDLDRRIANLVSAGREERS